MKKFSKTLLVFALIFVMVASIALFVACNKKSETVSREINISTTTSVNDTGLLTKLGALFEEQTGWKINVTSAGTGKAIQNAKDGNADVLLVHAKAQEEAFVTAGYARTVSGYNTERLSFMYNYFVLAGPTSDPANVENAATIQDGFNNIKSTASKFVSRGDNSGTHTKEISLWQLAGENNIGWNSETSTASYPSEYTWYTAAAAGMTASLSVANEQNAYILSDKGTYLKNKNGATDSIPNLKIVYEQDSSLKNTYTMIAVDPNGTGFGSTKPSLNTIGADAFINWMGLASTRQAMAQYGINEGYGEALFALITDAPTYSGTLESLKYPG